MDNNLIFCMFFQDTWDGTIDKRSLMQFLVSCRKSTAGTRDHELDMAIGNNQLLDTILIEVTTGKFDQVEKADSFMDK